MAREAAKKATKRGGRVRAWPLRKKTVFEAPKNVWSLSSRGGGLSGLATKKKYRFLKL